MTENERLTIDEIIQHCNRTCENTEMLAIARGQNQEDITSKGYWEHYQVANYLEELKQYRAIGLTLEVVQELKIMDIEQDGEIRGIIKSLKELGQYRAIGTVEELKTMKENGAFSGVELAQLAAMQMRLKEYQAIGTIEEFKYLKEKSVAKKPHSISIANDIGNSMVECPICHARSDYDVESIKRGYCWKCGQKLDWSE